jgi:hypothetical protein
MRGVFSTVCPTCIQYLPRNPPTLKDRRGTEMSDSEGEKAPVIRRRADARPKRTGSDAHQRVERLLGVRAI